MPDQEQEQPKEPKQPILHDLQEEELQQLAAQGSDMQKLVQTRAWRTYFAPVYRARCEQLEVEFLSKPHTYEEFVRIQQEWKATKNVLDRVAIAIQVGENAGEQLADKRKGEVR